MRGRRLWCGEPQTNKVPHMSLIFKILLVALLHFILFVCYPETGPNGNLYLCISMLAWAGFLIIANANLAFVKFISGSLSLLFNLTFFALMLAAIALTMPQLDKVTVLEKIQNRQFPDENSIKMGLIKLGVNYEGGLKYENTVKKEIKKLDVGINKAVDKLKKD